MGGERSRGARVRWRWPARSTTSGRCPCCLGFMLQVAVAALLVMTLPGEARVLPVMPVMIERGLLVGRAGVVHQSDELHGRHRLDDGRRDGADRGALAILGLSGIVPAMWRVAARRAGLTRRADRLCAVQPARGATVPRRCRQPADRRAGRLAADRAGGVGPLVRGADPAALLSGGCDDHACSGAARNGEKVSPGASQPFLPARGAAAASACRR